MLKSCLRIAEVMSDCMEPETVRATIISDDSSSCHTSLDAL